MPKQLSANKIKLLSQKYQLFVKNEQEKSVRKQLVEKCQNCLEKIRFVWNKIVPISIRGLSSERQIFDEQCMKKIGKLNTKEIISRHSIDQCLKEQRNNEDPKIIVGFLYSQSSVQRVVQFISGLSDHLKNQFSICMLSNQHEEFFTYFEKRIGYYDETLILLREGLFHQMIVLAKYRTTQANIFEEIKKKSIERDQYEMKIKQALFVEQSSINNTSEMVSQSNLALQ